MQTSEQEQINFAIALSLEEINNPKRTNRTKKCPICTEETDAFIYTICCNQTICIVCREKILETNEEKQLFFLCPFCRQIESDIDPEQDILNSIPTRPTTPTPFESDQEDNSEDEAFQKRRKVLVIPSKQKPKKKVVTVREHMVKSHIREVPSSYTKNKTSKEKI